MGAEYRALAFQHSDLVLAVFFPGCTSLGSGALAGSADSSLLPAFFETAVLTVRLNIICVGAAEDKRGRSLAMNIEERRVSGDGQTLISH
jgi:hypothetical protein